MPGDAPFLSDAETSGARPVRMESEALTFLAQLIYEQTTLRAWRDADFAERARSFLAARAVLEEVAAHD